MRLNFDPLVVTQRPFVVYLFFVVVNWITSTVLHFLLGFSLRETHCKSGVMMYHRSVDLAQPEVMVEEKGRGDSSFFEHVLAMYDNSSMSPDTDAPTEEEPEELPQKNNNAYPIVFIHGLGIGFAHYIYLIAGLPRDRDVYLVEMPYVCMRLDAVAPNMADTVSAIVEILTADGYAGPHSPSDISEVSIRTPSKQGTNQGGRYSLRSSSKDKKQSSGVHTVLGAAAQQSEANGTSVEKRIGACFVAHSLGTCVVSWMLHHKKTRSLVATTVLIDPVTFLLCMPKVCASFVHPDPKSVSTYVSSFMLAKELYIANALSRHFNWSHNAIFLENLPGAWEKEVFDDSKEDCAMPRFEILEPEFTARKLRSTVNNIFFPPTPVIVANNYKRIRSFCRKMITSYLSKMCAPIFRKKPLESTSGRTGTRLEISHDPRNRAQKWCLMMPKWTCLTSVNRVTLRTCPHRGPRPRSIEDGPSPLMMTTRVLY